MGEIIISPWLVWLASISPMLIATSCAIVILGSTYLLGMSHILESRDETIPYSKTIIVLMVLAYLNIVLLPAPHTIVRMVITNYITTDTTSVEYEILTQRVSNMLGVTMK